MTPGMIAAEVRKLVARRGLIVTSLVLPVVAVVLVVVISLVDRSVNPDSYENGAALSQGSTALTVFVMIIMAALLGATAGAWDVQNGTFRYMAMTGRSRLSLFLARVPALVVVVAALVVPAGVVNVLTALALPRGLGEDPSLADHLNAFWAPAVQGWVYGIVAMSVGALLRSVGGAIAVALVLNLAGLQALLLLGLVDDTLADIQLTAGVNRLVGWTDTSLALALVVTAAWLAAFLAAGAVRTIRSEY